MSKPFIYIAGLMRTGSTVLQESLTCLPYSFIFHEPRLGEMCFDIKDRFMVDLPVDVKGIMQSSTTVKRFKNHAMLELLKYVQQIGVKEIRPIGWERYLTHFPDAKVVLTARDPRDHFISMYGWVHDENGNQKKPFRGGEFNVQRVYNEIVRDFEGQIALSGYTTVIKVRYEDFVTDPSVLRELKKFVESPIPEGSGDIGGFLNGYAKRQGEHDIHGGEITSKRIDRWKTEENQELVARANDYYEMMTDYRNFWSY